jgi:hypothetical protein
MHDFPIFYHPYVQVDLPDMPIDIPPRVSRGGRGSQGRGGRGGRRASTRTSTKRRRADSDDNSNGNNSDPEFEQARRASLCDAKSAENKKELDATMALLCSDTAYADAVIDLKEDCLVCMEALYYNAEHGEPWQGACRVQCEGCGGSGPMVHTKCALKIESKCPVCRKPAAALFAWGTVAGGGV